MRALPSPRSGSALFPPRFLATLLLPFLALFAPCVAAPVINEVLYRPGSGWPENTALEFIELHNPDGSDADLSGWEITTGADFRFPAGTILPSGGYLLLAADPVAFAAATGVQALGPWKTGAKLSNNGEDLTLCNASGAVVDLLNYASEGDWALRTRDTLGGWSWVTAADGAGHSIERRNPRLLRDSGQNWGVSALAGGSPGRVNSVFTTNGAPLISSVNHSPAVPRSTDFVTLSCRLDDEGPADSLSAKLWWRNATGTSPGAFSSVTMQSQGGGFFSAVLPPLADKQIVEFYVEASDGALSRTWPAPTSEGQNANCCYQVDNENTGASSASYYRLVLTAAENAAFTTYTSAPGSSIGDRWFNVTLVATSGEQADIRYRSSLRVRGHSSRGYTIKPLRISLPNDQRWDGVSDFNLNPRGAPVAHLAHRAQRAAGLVAADTIPVEVRRQGLEYTVGTGASADYGRIVRVEEINGDYVDNHFPSAVSAQIYRKTAVSSWAYTGSTAPSNPDAAWSGWSKQSGSGANDWSDVMRFTKVWQDTAASHFTGETAGNVASGTWNGVPFSDAEVATLATVADLDYLARWLAAMTIMSNNEPNLSTGEDDDYAAAFVNDGSRTRLVVVPHDMDTTFGLGEQAFSATAVGLYDATETDTIARGGAGPVTLMKPLLPLLGDSTRAGNAAFRAKYLGALRELLGSVFDSDMSTSSYPPFHQFVDRQLDYVPASTRTAIKTWMSTRQAHLLKLIGQAKLSPPAPTSEDSLAAAATPALRLNEILASNTRTLAGPSSGYPDLVELHNSGGTAADLSGMSLSDDPAKPAKFVFPQGTNLAPGAYLVVHADTLSGGGVLHTGFALDADGDTLSLHASAANGGGLVDTIAFGRQLADKSLSRSAADPARWVLATPTPGAANADALPLGDCARLRLNEACGNRLLRVDEDFVELHNPLALPVALGGLRLSDDLYNTPEAFVFPALSFVDAGGFSVVDSDELGFGLDGAFDAVHLRGSNGSPVDSAELVAQAADHSTGRSSDGADTWADFAFPTPGLPNATAPTGAEQALLASLRISELMYAASGGNDYDYVELLNTGAATLDLGGVRFTSGIDYVFPAGTSLAAGATLVVCKKRSTFLARYPGAEARLAPSNYGGNLANEGERVCLALPEPGRLAIVNFSYDPGWYATTGTGASLTLRSTAQGGAAALLSALAWNASLNTLGSPGSLLAPTFSAAPEVSTRVGAALSLAPATGNLPVSFSASGLPPGLSLAAATGVLSGAPGAAGSYAVTLRGLNGHGSAETSLTLRVAPSVAPAGPASVDALAGGVTQLAVSASGGATPVELQWQKLVAGSWTDLPGENSAVLRLPAAQVYHSGNYRLRAVSGGLSTEGESFSLAVSRPASTDARLVNLSTRAVGKSGEQNLILGCVLKGEAPRRLLVRSIGPGLAAHGVDRLMGDPVLELMRLGGDKLFHLHAANDDWSAGTETGALQAAMASTGAFAVGTGSADAMLHAAYPPGTYTANTSGAGGARGMVLTEIYDNGGDDEGTRLVNMSTRGFVGEGDELMTAGFVIGGSQPATLLVRGVGPGLAAYGIQTPLANPDIRLHRITPGTGAAERLLSNDDWGQAAEAAEIELAATAVQAFALAPGSRDSALLVTLTPGLYTIEVRGAPGTSGVALVELYLLP